METKHKLPTWLKVKMPNGKNYEHLKNLVKTNQLNTVCVPFTAKESISLSE